MSRITVPRWFDRHLHLRDGDMLEAVLPCTINQRATGAVIMGNLVPPDETSTISKAGAYRRRIEALIPSHSDFKPRMTLYLTDDITPEHVVRGFREGVWCAAKLYIAGAGGTTGSTHGVRDLLGRYRVFEAMEEIGMPLLGHFEAVEPEIDEFDREIVSLERDLMPILTRFPDLQVVFEHITTGEAADFVAEGIYRDLYATVTAHHLLINRNAMFLGGMSPLHYCKPVPKRETDRARVRRHVTSGNRRFGAGTDSAPHDEQVKSRCHGCAAGIFTAPVAVELYTTVFDQDDALEHLGPFLSENFLHLYGMEVSTGTMELGRVVTEIPRTVGTVRTFMGGTELQWRLLS